MKYHTGWLAMKVSLRSSSWWDAEGRRLDLMLVFCGSAVQMMERLHSGEAPLAGCITGRLRVTPFTFRDAGLLLSFPDPIDTLTTVGILGGIPLYLSYFRADWTIRENLLTAIASSTARLYIKPQAIFAAHHDAYNPEQALGILRAIATGHRSWSEIAEAVDLQGGQLGRAMDRLIELGSGAGAARPTGDRTARIASLPHAVSPDG